MVDDEREQRQMFSRFLSSRGFQPITADSGIDALAKARTVRPHLALIDISMPKIDGAHLVKFLRSDPATARIPVILMTGLSIPEGFMEAAAESLKAGPIYIKGQNLFNLERRIESELRSGASPADSRLRRGSLVVDVGARQVSIDGHDVHVAGHRFDLLRVLMLNPGPVHRRVLLQIVWPAKENPSIVEVNILRLRRDLISCRTVSIEASPAGYHLVVAPAPVKAVFSV